MAPPRILECMQEIGMVVPYKPKVFLFGAIVKPVIGFKITKLTGLFDTGIMVKVSIACGQIYPADCAAIISVAGTEIILPPKPSKLAKAGDAKENPITKTNSNIKNLFLIVLLYNIFLKNHNIFLLILSSL